MELRKEAKKELKDKLKTDTITELKEELPQRRNSCGVEVRDEGIRRGRTTHGVNPEATSERTDPRSLSNPW